MCPCHFAVRSRTFRQCIRLLFPFLITFQKRCYYPHFIIKNIQDNLVIPSEAGWTPTQNLVWMSRVVTHMHHHVQSRGCNIWGITHFSFLIYWSVLLTDTLWKAASGSPFGLFSPITPLAHNEAHICVPALKIYLWNYLIVYIENS